MVEDTFTFTFSHLADAFIQSDLHMRQLYLTLPGLLRSISASSSASECVFSALPQDIFVHIKYTSLSCSRLVIFIFK